MAESAEKLMKPTFLERLADPAIRTVMIAGCGGGFDFVHGLLLYPELVRLGKTVVLGSYSFSDPEAWSGAATPVFEEGGVRAKRVTGATEHGGGIAPEVHVCSYLDERYPAAAPHTVYAYHARAFTVPVLTGLYRQLVRHHQVDAVVLVDGGSDSLIVGDEAGLGDPIEDAVSVQSVAALAEVPVRLLINVGLGVDRFNGISDHATLRAVAELTAQGGFLGAIGVEPGSESHVFYRAAIGHVYECQEVRSVVAEAVLAGIEGRFGAPAASDRPADRALPETLFVWPLMGILWAFDVSVVAERSLIGAWIRDAGAPQACYEAVRVGRRAVRPSDPDDERLPAAEPWPFAALFE